MRSSSESKPEAGNREAGFSLVEGLMAAALLLIVAVSVLPLFMRALESNTRGGRASQLSTLSIAAIEEINQATVDRQDFQLTGAASGVRRTGTMHWEMGELYDGEDAPAKIGDERWIADDQDPIGPVLWSRDIDVRKYSFADVHLSIGVGITELVAVTLGDPRWFDSPLETDGDGFLSGAHISEFRVHIKQNREGIPVAGGQRQTVGYFRAF